MVTTRSRWLVPLFALLAALALPGCTTGVLIADRDQAFQASGDRYVQLRLDTVQLEVVDTRPGDLSYPGALCLRGPAGSGSCRALQFKLPFLAWNGTDESWPVRLAMFSLERRRSQTIASADLLEAGRGDETVVLLPPHSGAHFDVLVHAAGLTADEDPLQGDYVLTVRGGGATSPVLLRQTLSVGSFNQAGQLLRFLGTATLLLVAAAAL